MAADASFGPGAGDAFKRAFDTLRPGGDPRFGAVTGALDTALKSGKLSDLKTAAQSLEGLVKDKTVNPAQAGGIAQAIFFLKNKIASLESSAAATGQVDSFSASGGTSGSSGASASASPAGTLDATFGPDSANRFNAAAGVLASNPAYGHAGMALRYVMDNLGSKSKASLTDLDKGAIQQAIIQMQSLVASRAVNPSQAATLNNAIWNLQGGLT